MAEADYCSQTALCRGCDALIWLKSGSGKAADAEAWMKGSTEILFWLRMGPTVVGSNITNFNDHKHFSGLKGTSRLFGRHVVF